VLRGGEGLDAANFEPTSGEVHVTPTRRMGNFIDKEITTLLSRFPQSKRDSVHHGGLRWISMIYNDECVGLQIPMVVELTVVEGDPGVGANSATGRTSPPNETGLVGPSPRLFAQLAKRQSDTRTGEFPRGFDRSTHLPDDSSFWVKRFSSGRISDKGSFRFTFERVWIIQTSIRLFNNILLAARLRKGRSD